MGIRVHSSSATSLFTEAKKKYTRAEVEAWDPKQVAEWAGEDVKVPKHAAKLADAELDGALLLGYTAQKFIDFVKIPAGPAEKLAIAVKELRVQIGMDQPAAPGAPLRCLSVCVLLVPPPAATSIVRHAVARLLDLNHVCFLAFVCFRLMELHRFCHLFL